MITEDYVSFETAKLLKKKGFENDAISCINVFKGHTYKMQDRVIDVDDDVTIPTIQMAMKWLRDVHNLIVSVKFTVHGWLCDITKIIRDSNGFIININHGICDDSLHYYDEYEEACEEAIKYCLENLV